MKRELDPLRVAAGSPGSASSTSPRASSRSNDAPRGHRVELPEPFAKAVERRLGELRALDELARHLHRGR